MATHYMARIISGILKGLQLKIPDGVDTRPTKAAVREAIFNSLSSQVEGSTFFDLYAGSGPVGLEAASWGAQKVFSVEKNKSTFKCLQQNIEAALDTFKKNNCQIPTLIVKQEEVNSFLKRTTDEFDILFFDPPYEKTLEELQANMPLVGQLAKKDSVFILESKKNTGIDKEVLNAFEKSDWKLYKSKTYGIVKIDYFIKL